MKLSIFVSALSVLVFASLSVLASPIDEPTISLELPAGESLFQYPYAKCKYLTDKHGNCCKRYAHFDRYGNCVNSCVEDVVRQLDGKCCQVGEWLDSDGYCSSSGTPPAPSVCPYCTGSTGQCCGIYQDLDNWGMCRDICPGGAQKDNKGVCCKSRFDIIKNGKCFVVPK